MRLHHIALATSVLIATVAACTAGSTTQSPIVGSDSGSSGGGGDGGGQGEDAGKTGNTMITADGLSKTCAADTDCVAVYVGDVCGFCNIGNVAIAKTDEATYQNEYNAARANCPPVMGGGSCIADQNITICNAQKQCQLVMCSSQPFDAHHCGADGG